MYLGYRRKPEYLQKNPCTFHIERSLMGFKPKPSCCEATGLKVLLIFIFPIPFTLQSRTSVYCLFYITKSSQNHILFFGKMHHWHLFQCTLLSFFLCFNSLFWHSSLLFQRSPRGLQLGCPWVPISIVSGIFCDHFRGCRRGKRSGVLVHLHWHRSRTTLPVTLFSNVSSLCN